MNKKNAVILLAGLLLSILASAYAVAGDVMDDARNASWRTDNLKALKEVFSDIYSVDPFIRRLRPDLSDLGIPPSIGEYDIADLGKDGTLQLVVTLDWNGGGFYNSILAVQNVQGEFKTSEIKTNAPFIDLKMHVVDLRGDGSRQILVRRYLGEYEEGKPLPYVYDVYRWTGAGLEAANRHYQDYHRQVLAVMQADLEAARQMRGFVPDQELRALPPDRRPPRPPGRGGVIWMPSPGVVQLLEQQIAGVQEILSK